MSDLTALEKQDDCGMTIWEFSDGTDLFAMTPVPHPPHPAEDDIVAWADWYIVTAEMLSDFHGAFRAGIQAVEAA